jgi:hypothetical protein
VTQDFLRWRLTRVLPAACGVAAIAWIMFSLQLGLGSLIGLAAAVGALVVATLAIVMSEKGASRDPSWLRAINLLIVALMTVSVGLLTLGLVLTRGDLPDAALGAAMFWIVVHMPIYSFLPRNTYWQAVVAGTAVQWTFIAVIIARVTRGVRTSGAVGLAVGTILTVAAAMMMTLMLLGFRPWLEGP